MSRVADMFCVVKQFQVFVLFVISDACDCTLPAGYFRYKDKGVL